MLRSISIGKRFIVVLAIMVITALGTTLAFYFNAEKLKSLSVGTTQDVMLDGQKQMLKTAVHSLATSLGDAIKSAESQEEKMEILQTLTANVRFGEDKSGYYFTFHKTINVAHPANPSLHNTDMGGAKDVNGMFFVKEMAARAHEGGGFVEYVFAKPGHGDQPKLGYSEMIPGTEFWIGTGVYIDNIEVAKAAIANTITSVIEENLMFIIGSLVAAFALLVLPLFIAITRSINRPIAEATQAAQSISDNNLDINLDATGRDEAAQLQSALISMADTLRDNISEINQRTQEAQEKADAASRAQSQAEAALKQAETAKAEGLGQAAAALETVVERVSTAMTQVSSTSEEIRNRTAMQQDRIQTTATAMTEMNATVLEVAQSSSNAAEMSENAKQKAQDGARVVEQSVQAMETTQHQTQILNENMTQLGEQAQAIGNIMGVITDIADQTNLLALNAAIEAARAGEAGRGFAVVADEVRKLAEKTMNATKEVGDSIQSIQKVADNNMTAMQEAMNDLAKAAELSNQSGEVLREIVLGSDESAGQIQGIATAAEQQSAASEEINQSIEEINTMTAETADGIHETTSAIMEISEQVVEIKNIVEGLKMESQIAGQDAG